MLYPPDGLERVGYSRPSKLAHGIDDSSYLIPWQVHTALRGLAINKPLYQRLLAMVAAGKTWEDDKGEWQNVINKAQVSGGGDEKADRGTAIHDLCEAAEIGWLDYDLVDEELVPVMQGYEERILPEFSFIARECFVAADITIGVPDRDPWKLRAAGSIDRICEWNGTRYVVDIKSGRDDEFRTGVTAQTYLYRQGKLYRDPDVPQQADWATWYPADEVVVPAPRTINSQPNPEYGLTEPINPSERAELNCDDEFALMFLAPRGDRTEWQVHKVPLDRGAEIIVVGQWAAKARYVKKFERVL